MFRILKIYVFRFKNVLFTLKKSLCCTRLLVCCHIRINKIINLRRYCETADSLLSHTPEEINQKNKRSRSGHRGFARVLGRTQTLQIKRALIRQQEGT